jgi:hypothetical protein
MSQEVVERIKQNLVDRGVNLKGPCGAFEIIKRVVWFFRHEGAGLVLKPGGNNCKGYSVDWIVFKDGRGGDILGDAGNTNSPRWDIHEGVEEAARWAPPIDPLDDTSESDSDTDDNTSDEAIKTLDELFGNLVSEIKVIQVLNSEAINELKGIRRDLNDVGDILGNLLRAQNIESILDMFKNQKNK